MVCLVLVFWCVCFAVLLFVWGYFAVVFLIYF